MITTPVASDIEIAQSATLDPIGEVAQRLGLDPDDWEPYGRTKAKIDLAVLDRGRARPAAPAAPGGRLVLVTAMSPTPAGEGKTVTTVGLADALRRTGRSSVVALREPSLGPVFGVKGGAAGGGRAQVVPMEDINLHFTGDLPAITAATNLLAAMVDNHIHHGNALNIDPRRITWKRAMDVNDRQLRGVVSGLGGVANGTPREEAFQITAASEVMAVVCLASSQADLRERLSRMVVGYTYPVAGAPSSMSLAADVTSTPARPAPAPRPVTAGDLHAAGALAALLRDALKPNLVQTLEHTPALVHGGPFANIAHGCNSVVATRMARQLADYAVTEAGFGADLGAEKFLDIVTRSTGMVPDVVVVVGTVRSLKMHGGVSRSALASPDVDAVRRGAPNLLQHVATITDVFGLPAVVALNVFPTDTEEELGAVEAACAAAGVHAVRSEVWARGGEGGLALARAVIGVCERSSGCAGREGAGFRHAYDLDASIEDKLNRLCRTVYRADGAELTPSARRQARALERDGFGGLPVCVAKTPYSFADDPSLLGAPRGFTVTVRDLTVSAGAGFVVAMAGSVTTMPGLPASPAAERVDVDADGRITGLF